MVRLGITDPWKLSNSGVVLYSEASRWRCGIDTGSDGIEMSGNERV